MRITADNPAPEIVALVDFATLYGQQPPDGAIAAALRPLPLVETLTLLSALDAIVGREPQHAQGLQISFARELGAFDPETRDRLIARLRDGAVWIHEAQIAVLSRYALQHCGGRLPPRDTARCIFRALLAYNQSYNDDIHEREAGERGKFLRSELQSVLTDKESIFLTMVRYDAFFAWARTEDARTFRDDWMDVDAAFRDSTGLGIDEFRPAIMGLQIVFRGPTSIDEVDRVNPAIDVEVALANLEAGNPVARVVELLSTTVDDARATFVRTPESPSMFGLMPFAKRPLLRLPNGTFVVPARRYILNAICTGLFYRLSDHFSASGAGQFERFHRFFGHFLEQHVRAALRSATSRRTSAVDGDRLYATRDGEKRSSDIYLLFGRALVILEVTSSRFNVRRSLFEEDEAVLEADLDNMVVSKFEQIRNRYDDWMAGAFDMLGIDREDVKRVFAVVVTAQYVPHVFALSDRIQRRIENLVDVFDGFEVLETEETELLGRQFPNGNLNLYELLTRKNRTEAGRLRSLTNYLYFFRPDLIYIRASEDVTDDPVFRRAQEVAATWFRNRHEPDHDRGF